MKSVTIGLQALVTREELAEVQAIGTMRVITVKLKRTFNQKLLDGSSIRFWRVLGPQSHPNLNSDLSLEGLKEWGVL